MSYSLPVLVSLAVASTLHAAPAEAPLRIPQELKTFAAHLTAHQSGPRAKMTALYASLLQPTAQGGMGLSFDDSRIRTVDEAWRDRKADGLALTALFVGACQSVGIDARFAESLNTNGWHQTGDEIRNERNVVAIIRFPGTAHAIINLTPQRRSGSYLVASLKENRVIALYRCNQAAHLLAENGRIANGSEPKGLLDQARQAALEAKRIDPKFSASWNAMGTVLAACGETAQAEQAYRQALTLDPKDTAAIDNLERLFRASGQTEAASTYQTLGAKVRSENPYYNAFVAEQSFKAGNLDAAQERIGVALTLLPHESEFYLFRAKLKRAQGRPEEAAQDLHEAETWSDFGERAQREILRSIFAVPQTFQHNRSPKPSEI